MSPFLRDYQRTRRDPHRGIHSLAHSKILCTKLALCKLFKPRNLGVEFLESHHKNIGSARKNKNRNKIQKFKLITENPVLKSRENQDLQYICTLADFEADAVLAFP